MFQKHFLKRFMSLAISALLITGYFPLNSFAEETMVLEVEEPITITGEANIDGDVEVGDQGSISLTNESTVNVSGDVDSSSGDTFIVSDNSTLEVSGNVTVDNSASVVDVPGVTGIRVNEGGEITVQGDVSVVTDDNATAVSVSDGGTADIGGNLTVEPKTEGANPAQIALDVSGYGTDNNVNTTTAHVGQNVKGDIISAYGGEATIDGNVTGNIDAYNPGSTVTVGQDVDGNIHASNEAYVRIEGNVEGEVVASDNGQVVIDGGITGSVTSHGSDSIVSVVKDVQGNIYAYNPGSTVTVRQDVDGDILVWNEGHAQIGGNVDGYIGVFEKGDVTIEGDAFGIVSTSSESDAKIKGSVIGEVLSSNESRVIVDGDVSEGISAYEKGSVETGGDVSQSVRVRDESSVTIEGSVNADPLNFNEVSGSSELIVGKNFEGRLFVGSNYNYTYDPVTGSTERVEVTGDTSKVSIGGDLEGNMTVHSGSANVSGNVKGHVIGESTAVISIGGDILGTYTRNPDGSLYLKSGVTSRDNASIEVEGNVTGTVSAYENGEVNIEGDITGQVNSAIDDSHVQVSGSVDGNVFAGGNRSAEGVEETATVEVGGDVSGDVSAVNGTKVTVAGNVGGIVMSQDGSAVKVGGDVEKGILIDIKSNTESPKITVEGTVNSDGTGITLYATPTVNMTEERPVYPQRNNYSSEEEFLEAVDDFKNAMALYHEKYDAAYKQATEEMNSEQGVEALISALPQIIVQTLQPEGDFVLVTGNLEKENRNKISEALLSQINYIVNTEGVDSANIAVYGYENLDGYHVAQETKRLTVKSTLDGFIIADVKAGRFATITDNGDGSYSIIVERGGDLNISASLVAKPAPIATTVSRQETYDTYEGAHQMVIPVYQTNELIIDMTATDYAAILVSTFKNFQNKGFETVILRTYAGDYVMSMDELLALADNGILYTFYVHDSLIDIYIDYQLVTTLSMSKRT